MAENIVKTEYSELMQKSYIDYSMSVITARALPDVRDGLKPVQRRVLYAMDQLGLNYDKPHRKSARIVGDAMGKYHPHGDSSIYETLVVMSQDFKKGMALVDGHGNFGSIEGDGAAAMRYTEAKLKKFTQDVYLADLDKDVVDFIPNFDETEKEPAVLPVRVPNLLVNGADGIAVGMTTNIPTHNLGEVIDAVCAYMDNVNITTQELMQYCPGPDFPTGGLVVNKSELPAIYETGTGKIKLRGKVVFEPAQKRGEKDKLVITEIPYTMIGANIGKFISDVVELIESKKATDIVDISNESSKEGIRIVLELKKNADVENLKNLLYKKTKLEDTFGVNMLAIVDGRPETLGIKKIIEHHINFQYEIATRKYTTLLNKELANKEIKEGLIRACDIIDLIIEILRGSTNLKMAKECLMTGNAEGIKFKSEASKKQASQLDFTERQASAILEMRLYKLIGLEILALQKEYDEACKKIARYEKILGSRKEMAKVIKEDLMKIKKEYSVGRRTVIEDGKEAVFIEKKIPEQEVMFIMDRFGYAKTIDMAAYERNKEAVHNEYKYIFSCMNTDKICIFTDNGMLHQIKVKDIPFSTKFRDKGTPIDNLGNYDSSGERIIYLCASERIRQKRLLFVTKLGMMKLVDTSEFDVMKKTVASTKLTDGDELIGIYETDARTEVLSKFNYDGTVGEEEVVSSDQNIILQTANGVFLKFPLTDVPQKKKNAVGVRGIKLGSDDYIEDVYILTNGDELSMDYKGKMLDFGKMKMAHRDTKGTKVRR
ncbi:DNA gyrase/topoisomerase IV subunit A [Lachnospira hominis (ex Liu et al. 2021)]|uniref:DNA topoisomerase (ATP-hydrolyzing) n=1 Tax=Lachnospira hominis (ex Liu et al. 2021) TaxID=2763051 RepID=A0ABR7G1E6_9FIRM|nr:DNA topoisomerase (ATP-hydrolyzing) [Lachnospira hominis]MBC5681267.1 DNA topoisomerase 4 subunit A [Lachnospira hominis]